MTMDEAKTKWCPFANQGSVSAFRIISPAGAGPGAHTLCIADECMAWRTRPIRSHETFSRSAGQSTSLVPDTVRLDGFCGFAGAPQ